MNTQPFAATEPHFSVPAWISATFATTPSFARVCGPATLVRLVQFAKRTYDGLDLKSSRIGGDFWFEEELLLRLMSQARTDLAQQQATAKQPFSTPMPILIGNYVRHCLRTDLAICKDWTGDFDAFVRLRLMPGESLLALVGPVARQAAYSESHALHKNVVAKNIWLEGQATQYVIDFTFSLNRPWLGCIMGPFRF